MTGILVIGACSAMATETARLYAQQGASIFLAARNEERLAALTADLQVRGAERVGSAVFEALEYDQHSGLVQTAREFLGDIDVVLVAHGSLGEQTESAASFVLTRQEFEINALSVMSLLSHVVPLLRERSAGSIAVISSVAGDRGRQSNYVYGAAKGALSIYLQGLRNELASVGVSVLTVKPGFVDTPMTAHIAKGSLWASPEDIARGIVRGIERGQDVLYLPWFWRYIMWIIRMIPERLFKRLSL